MIAEPVAQRIEAIVERYWSVFMRPFFRTMLDITLGVTGEPARTKRLQDRLDDARAGYVAIWLDVFRDIRRSDAELTATLGMVMSAARGFGVLKTFQPNENWVAIGANSARSQPTNSSVSRMKPTLRSDPDER